MAVSSLVHHTINNYYTEQEGIAKELKMPYLINEK